MQERIFVPFLFLMWRFQSLVQQQIFFVLIDIVQSKYGVPQGSNLGPMLFFIQIHFLAHKTSFDICNICNNSAPLSQLHQNTENAITNSWYRCWYRCWYSSFSGSMLISIHISFVFVSVSVIYCTQLCVGLCFVNISHFVMTCLHSLKVSHQRKEFLESFFFWCFLALYEAWTMMQLRPRFQKCSYFIVKNKQSKRQNKLYKN